MPKPSKHFPGPFDICTKHRGAYVSSCGCYKEGKKNKEEKPEVEPLDERESE